jgi:hypothetical protein
VLWQKSLLEATGTADSDLAEDIVSDLHLACMSGAAGSISPTNSALAAMAGLQPKNELEGMLCAQMVATHSLAMKTLAGANKGQYPVNMEISVNQSTKLMRTFLMQVDALQKLRGKTTQQKFIVEHVNVAAGGQAIVGAVTHTGRGEGE